MQNASMTGKAKEYKTEYLVHPISRVVIPKYYIPDEKAFFLDTYAKFIIYRRGKKEIDEPVQLTINDSIVTTVLPYSCLEFHIKISREPIIICSGDSRFDDV